MLAYDKEMQLTPSFKLGEFMVSDKHPSAIEGIILRADEILKFYWLCLFCLQPTRDKWGALRITSGFRTAYLNSLVGGVSTSQHCFAEACDFVPQDAMAEVVFNWMVDSLRWKGEIILYKGENRLHVGMPNPAVHADQFVKEK